MEESTSIGWPLALLSLLRGLARKLLQELQANPKPVNIHKP